MPNRAARPCRYGRCPYITTHESGLCEQHRHIAYQQNDAQRGTAAERGYGARWKTLRDWFLRENPYCVMCAAIGKQEQATEVDHIVPHKGDDDLMWDVANLEALCSWHHKSKTAKERQAHG